MQIVVNKQHFNSRYRNRTEHYDAIEKFGGEEDGKQEQ